MCFKFRRRSLFARSGGSGRNKHSRVVRKLSQETVRETSLPVPPHTSSSSTGSETRQEHQAPKASSEAHRDTPTPVISSSTATLTSRQPQHAYQPSNPSPDLVPDNSLGAPPPTETSTSQLQPQETDQGPTPLPEIVLDTSPRKPPLSSSSTAPSEHQQAHPIRRPSVEIDQDTVLPTQPLTQSSTTPSELQQPHPAPKPSPATVRDSSTQTPPLTSPSSAWAHPQPPHQARKASPPRDRGTSPRTPSITSSSSTWSQPTHSHQSAKPFPEIVRSPSPRTPPVIESSTTRSHTQPNHDVRMEDTLALLDVNNPPEERLRLLDSTSPWRLFGPYLSDRQWGTVREDYSHDGEAWSWFPHDDARSRAYRWGEDGLLGYCDEKQLLNFSLSMWNGRDPILKSRLWGLTNDEGVHGEDVKEVYFFEDATPTSSYLRGLYRYPCDEFPYRRIVEENRKRRSKLYDTGRYFPEFELVDTGIFDGDRFFDVSVEYFKNAPLDTFIAITVENASDTVETITLLPTLCFRNTWSWSEDGTKPIMRVGKDLCDGKGVSAISCDAIGEDLPAMALFCENLEQSSLLFCDNETDLPRFEGRSICRSLYKKQPTSNYPKNGIDDYVIDGDCSRVNPAQEGSKAAAMFLVDVQPKSKKTIRLRLLPMTDAFMERKPFASFDEVLHRRKREADKFYAWVSPAEMSSDDRDIQRQAFAGMLWSRMTYIYNVSTWLAEGPQSRRAEGARNRDWLHFNAEDIISACDGWEYPWFAAWDAAFHNVVFAMIDPEFAKSQVLLLLGQSYVSSNGQIPAYEWDLEDCNPPLQAWSAHKVYCIEKQLYGIEDRSFLRHCYPRLNRFYTWYVTSTDIDGHRTAGRSFLGLDNISVVDRSKQPYCVEALYQADGTAWAAAAALTMMKISLELKEESSAAFASQFFVDASFRAMALNNYDGDFERPGYNRPHLYSEHDGFYYDVIKLRSDKKLHSISAPTVVGILPIVAIETIDMNIGRQRPEFSSSVREYFGNKHHAKLGSRITSDTALLGSDAEMSNSFDSKTEMGVFTVSKDQLRRILKKVLDPNEFLSPFGIRSASKALEHKPFRFDAGEGEREFRYLPAESYGDGKMFGGNSSWRGSIWMPTTYLIIESLIKYHSALGDEFLVECPTGSGSFMNLRQVAFEIASRISLLFRKDSDGIRPSLQPYSRYRGHPKWDKPLFFEYFNGDNGAGIGASHQTGWTGLIADLLARMANERI